MIFLFIYETILPKIALLWEGVYCAVNENFRTLTQHLYYQTTFAKTFKRNAKYFFMGTVQYKTKNIIKQVLENEYLYDA